MERHLNFELNFNLESILPRYSDKAVFPPSILSLIINSYGESSLPHPLIFKIWHNQRACYIGVKEFSSNEGEIILPWVIAQKLVLEDGDTIRVELVDDIPKGKSLTLKPLQFYPQIPNWKFFLESKLSHFYTTLTRQDTLHIEDGGTIYELFIEAVDESLDTVGIIDTDMVLDVIPLNDIMAKQQLEFNESSHYVDSDKISELFLNDEIQILDLKPFNSQDFRPQIYKIDISNYENLNALTIKLATLEYGDYSSLFNIDLVIGMDKLVNLENFRWTTMNQDFDLQSMLDNHKSDKYEKSVTMDIQNNDELLSKKNITEDDNADHYVYIVPFTWQFNGNVQLSVSKGGNSLAIEKDDDIKEDAHQGTMRCLNCNKPISPEKFKLHESFCIRNNVKCSCGLVFLKEIPPNHWHCEMCNDSTKYGSSSLLRFKHNKLFHEEHYVCTKCSSTTEFHNYIDLVNHKSSDCPGKLHECRFCFLIVPQEESTYEDKVANLSHHENSCGNKTTECFKCNKVLRTKDLSKHLKLHDLDKIQMNQNTKLNFKKCLNENCIVVIKDTNVNELGLCDYCFGSVYIPQHDPTNLKLQNRIERKYMIQLSKGCGFGWCKNANCKSYNPLVSTNKLHKELLEYINNDLFSKISTPSLPINRGKVPPPNNTLWFCVNESIQMKKDILMALIAENEYDEELIYKPINELSIVTEDAVREWLLHNGVKKS